MVSAFTTTRNFIIQVGDGTRYTLRVAPIPASTSSIYAPNSLAVEKKLLHLVCVVFSLGSGAGGGHNSASERSGSKTGNVVH